MADDVEPRDTATIDYSTPTSLRLEQDADASIAGSATVHRCVVSAVTTTLAVAAGVPEGAYYNVITSIVQLSSTNHYYRPL